MYQTKLVLKWNKIDEFSIYPTKRIFSENTSNIFSDFSKNLNIKKRKWPEVLLKFHQEVGKLKKILKKQIYIQKFIDKCTQKFLNKMFIQTPQIATVSGNELIIILSYLDKRSQIVKIVRLWLNTRNFVN